ALQRGDFGEQWIEDIGSHVYLGALPQPTRAVSGVQAKYHFVGNSVQRLSVIRVWSDDGP
ncbi:MAG: hypothetical protein OSB00_07375, partial [Sphingomonas bacterium]|nr:hypothetical protein [Sphingomonas bacterium]